MPTPTHSPPLPLLIYISLLTPFILYDSLYIFLRPHSFPTGAYAAYFTHMIAGADVDRLYGEAAWREGDGVIVAQGMLSCVEVGLWLMYLILAMGGRKTEDVFVQRKRKGKVLCMGYAAGVLGAGKTGHYFLREVASGFKYTGHAGNPMVGGWGIFMMVYLFVNAIWVGYFGTKIVDGLSEGMEEKKRV